MKMLDKKWLRCLNYDFSTKIRSRENAFTTLISKTFIWIHPNTQCINMDLFNDRNYFAIFIFDLFSFVRHTKSSNASTY